MEHEHSEHEHGSAGGTGSDCVFHHALVFHTGVCQEVLFPGWRTTTGLEVFGSAVALFVAGVLYEGLKYFRDSLVVRTPSGRDSQVNIAKNECGDRPCAQTTVVKQSMFSSSHLMQTALHIVQTTASYLLMLIFMTYNLWLCMGLVLGIGCGYFLFGWRKHTVVDLNEHCQ